MNIPKSISKDVFVPALRKYLEGTISPKELRWWMIEQLDDVEKDIDAGEDTKLLTHLYWAVRTLTDPPEFRASDVEIRYLLRCLEGKEVFDIEHVNEIYAGKPECGIKDRNSECGMRN